MRWCLLCVWLYVVVCPHFSHVKVVFGTDSRVLLECGISRHLSMSMKRFFLRHTHYQIKCIMEELTTYCTKMWRPEIRLGCGHWGLLRGTSFQSSSLETSISICIRSPGVAISFTPARPNSVMRGRSSSICTPVFRRKLMNTGSPAKTGQCEVFQVSTPRSFVVDIFWTLDIIFIRFHFDVRLQFKLDMTVEALISCAWLINLQGTAFN